MTRTLRWLLAAGAGALVLVASPGASAQGYARGDLLIETEAAAKLLGQPNVRLIDAADAGLVAFRAALLKSPDGHLISGWFRNVACRAADVLTLALREMFRKVTAVVEEDARAPLERIAIELGMAA